MLDILLMVIAMAGGAGDAPAEASAKDGTVTETLALDLGKDAAPASGEELPPGAVPAAEPEPEVLPYEAEQQVATGRFTTALEVKPIFNATRNSWIAIREYNGQDLVYVTQIWSWRCGLVALHYGVNDEPLEPWPLPKCHEDTNSPNVMKPEDGLPYREYPLGSVETVTVELIFDDLTKDRVTYNRKGALMP
ncbi:hypothetical protein TRP8649_03124 [Pelagimonas phthalicica]|uniref:Uncharacterized protein n=1 Tax=Pelagimonas phthalicica TaxID=1037362 RepID=A0A238JGR9_9RHOB|nr:hypothetical protein [Pelagimonas phthalicica]TDS91946.1 hypothetical protein CLV87_3125 [Pelagimonas phthalicica]SMX28996.1 hypothetical protein TRP8649_03124 [Pelagimonas phthalicica]